MKRRINFGFSSILISFIMICIVTFSALSLITANADYKLSQKVANRNIDYYAAEAQAQERVAEIDDTLATIYQHVDNGQGYIQLAQRELPNGTWSDITDQSGIYSFTQQVSGNQYLLVSLLVQYPDQYTKTYYRTVKWCTYIEEEPFEEQPLNLIGSNK